MDRRLFLLSPALLMADPAGGDPRLEKLFAKFIAPCCWRENLMAHQSPEADKMRQRIRGMVAEGKTDEEIKQTFLSEYSLRILSEPEGGRGRWLSWTPQATAVAGGAFVTWYIRRSLQRNAEARKAREEEVYP
jgi:cytochrome c-type biogenesis protein CcmH